MRRYTIAGIGEILWGVLPETEVLGELHTTGTFDASLLYARHLQYVPTITRANQSAEGVAGIARVTAL